MARPLPRHDEERVISRLLPPWQVALEYCVLSCLENQGNGASMSYDQDSQEIVYRYTLTDTDRELCEVLQGSSEIWIVTGCGRDS